MYAGVIAALLWVGSLGNVAVPEPDHDHHSVLDLVSVGHPALPRELEAPALEASAVLRRNAVDPTHPAPDLCAPARSTRAADSTQRARRWRRRPRMRAGPDSDH